MLKQQFRKYKNFHAFIWDLDDIESDLTDIFFLVVMINEENRLTLHYLRFTNHTKFHHLTEKKDISVLQGMSCKVRAQMSTEYVEHQPTRLLMFVSVSKIKRPSFYNNKHGSDFWKRISTSVLQSYYQKL